MTAVISWVMKGDRYSVRYLLMDRVLMVVESNPNPLADDLAVACTYDSVEQAHDVAIKQTHADCEGGYLLDGPVRMTTTDADVFELAAAYEDREPVWYMLGEIILDAQRGRVLS